LIGFGIAFDQIFRSLRERFPDMNAAITRNTATLIGMGFIEVGLVLLGIALVQHRLAIKSIEHPNYVMLSVRAFNRLVVLGIIILSLAGLVATLFLI
jgi:putative membrane protein